MTTAHLRSLLPWIALFATAAASASEMVMIPEGQFTMGALDQDHGGHGVSDEYPVHEVYLDSYEIDVEPVTNAEYARCVQAGVCQPPMKAGSATRVSYYGDPAYADFPVVYMHWQDADTYCRFVGKELPTEAQWEKAARGDDGRTYPWGESIDASLANFFVQGVRGDTVAVGHYPGNVSPYGVRDMAGNVLQWVRDWYDYDYYQSSPGENPYRSTPINEYSLIKALRGGSVAFEPSFLRTTSRFGLKLAPENTFGSVGFRCARE